MKMSDRGVAVYKGENIVAMGTVEEVAKELKVKQETVKWFATPSAAKRGKNIKVAVWLD